MLNPTKNLMVFLWSIMLLFIGVTAVTAVLPGQAAADKPNIVEIASGDDRFETLVAALQAADLVEPLQGEGPFTVFAPTDDAFDKLPDGTLEALLNDIPTLQKILLYHVAAGKYLAEDVVELTELETLQGEKADIRVEDGKVFINEAQIIVTDIKASNGVIHVLDTVITPPSLQPKPDIVEIASGDDRFETLVAALQAADLVEPLQGEGPFTVFAPTDDAFDKLPDGTLETLLNDIPTLQKILLYHVAAGKYLAEDVVELTELETLQGEKIQIRVEGDKVFVNDAQIIVTDIEASNGVIHVIDTVLIPPSLQPKTIVDIAAGDDRFETLVAALQAADLVETLQGEGPFTVFAPTDDAFDKLPDGTLEALLNDIPTLKQILLYHVVPGRLLAADVVQQTELTTAQGYKVKIRIEGEKVFVNDAQIIVTDIEASNGVIHVLDTVLLPPQDIVDIAAADNRFKTLVTALQAAGLVDTLKGDGPFTVFAPTDDAFASLPKGTLEALLNDIPTLQHILLYHVVPGRLLAADVVQQTELTTAQGEKVKIKIQGDKVFINDARIIVTDIQASNGVIHAINAVLTPPSLRPKVDVYLVHGIPGQALGADPALAVDVSVDGACALPGFTFSQIAGPLSLPVDTYQVAISLANANAPCSNTPVIGPVSVSLAAGENVSIVAHLTPKGEPTASKFVNDVSPIKSDRTRLVVRHVADAPAVDVKIFRRGQRSSVEVFQDVANGNAGLEQLHPGRYNVQVFSANNSDRHLVQSGFQSLKARTLTIEYVVGAPSSNSLTILKQTLQLPRTH